MIVFFWKNFYGLRKIRSRILHFFLVGFAICNNIQDKLWQPHRHVLLQTPISVVALEALGKLAEKFPNLAGTLVVGLLCSFLLTPCPLLTKLGKSETEKTVVNKTMTDISGRKKLGLISLRTAAIDGLCRALKAAMKDEGPKDDKNDETLIRTCLTQLSSKLYFQENASLDER